MEHETQVILEELESMNQYDCDDVSLSPPKICKLCSAGVFSLADAVDEPARARTRALDTNFMVAFCCSCNGSTNG